MSNRWPGGLIRKTPVTPTTASAVGVWTLAEALYWQKQGQWPTPGDPDFENVTLLLPGNGTNGAQNNTFLDSSPNNFTITRNGDTTQGSFSPYGGLWSNYFDGSGDYIDVASNAAFGFGTGDFTVEGWFFATAPTSGNKVAIDFRASGYSGQQWVFGFGNSVTPYYYDGSDKYATSSMVANTWNHVAWVRSAGSVYMYLNGVSVFTATASSVGTASSNVRVGADANGSFSQPCYISNLRIVKGTAVYTSNFTPPTAPLTAISGTSLLTCQSNRFRDASTNNFAITANGNTSVTNFAPFNPSAAYSPAVNGGSGYFDGNGDYLTVAGGMPSGAGSAFTMECWIYLNDISDYRAITRGDAPPRLDLGVAPSGQILLDNVISANICASATGVIQANRWHHVAVTRSTSNIYKIWVDGVNVATSATYATSMAANTTIGYSAFSASYFFIGYISNFRVVTSEVYTSNFTPPTAPLTAITNTSLLLNFTNAGIVDASAKNDLVTVGNAQISTAQSKFGGSSMYFDGTGDYLSLASNAALDLTSGDFTVEGWFYCGGLTADTQQIINKDGTYGSSYPQYCVGITSTGKLRAEIGSGSGTSYVQTVVGASTISLNTWNHFAFTKNGSTLRVFLNGAIDATATQSGTMTSGAKALLIGYQTGQPAGQYFNGYIDDLRVTKGVARYTANFTPPTAPFPPK